MKNVILGLILFCGIAFAAEFVVSSASGEKINEISGVIYSKNEAALSSKMGGFISAFFVEEGDRVKQGQTLFEIDQNAAQTSQSAAKAAIEEAKKNLGRYKTLFDKGVISQNELERIEIDYEVKKAGLAQSEGALKYSVVKAPFDGVIAKKNFSVGSFAAPGQPIVIVQSDKGLRFRATTGEAQAKNFTLGQQVGINAAGKKYDAKILSVTNIGAMNYEIRAEIANQDGLTPGVYAALQGATNDASAFSVSPSTLTKRGGVIGVFENANGIAKFYPVKVIQERADSVLVSGVKGGMKLIVSPKASLLDGAKVQ